MKWCLLRARSSGSREIILWILCRWASPVSAMFRKLVEGSPLPGVVGSNQDSKACKGRLLLVEHRRGRTQVHPGRACRWGSQVFDPASLYPQLSRYTGCLGHQSIVIQDVLQPLESARLLGAALSKSYNVQLRQAKRTSTKPGSSAAILWKH